MPGRSIQQVILFAGMCLLATAAYGQQTKSALTNDDVKVMASKGFTDELIVGAIEANETQFDVSVGGLMALKEAGVSDKVISAMLKAESKRREAARAGKSEATQAAGNTAAPGAAPSPAANAMMPPMGAAGNPTNMAQQMLSSMGMGGMASGMMGGGGFAFDPSQLPVVTLLEGDAKPLMRASFSQIAHTETKGNEMPGTGANAARMLSSLGAQALSFAAIGGGGMMAGPAMGMAMGMMGGMGGLGGGHGLPKITHVWALPGRESGIPMKVQTPRFQVVYGNLLGIDPDSYEPQLVKLVQTKDNWRLVGATKMQMGKEDLEALEKVTEVRVPVKISRTGRGDVLIEPQRPLEPGEYGLVLRPLRPGKRSKGSLGGPAETNAFFSVWDFSVAATASSPAPIKK